MESRSYHIVIVTDSIYTIKVPVNASGTRRHKLILYISGHVFERFCKFTDLDCLSYRPENC